MRDLSAWLSNFATKFRKERISFEHGHRFHNFAHSNTDFHPSSVSADVDRGVDVGCIEIHLRLISRKLISSKKASCNFKGEGHSEGAN